MRNKRQKTEVLKRRFKIKKKNDPESINPFGDFKSKYAHLCACKYFDSDQFAIYEEGFPEMARDFYTKSGADRYNHDALDLDVDKHVIDEHKHIDEQFESHLVVLEDLHVGVEIEKTSVTAQKEFLDSDLQALRDECEELKKYYSSFNRKAG